MPAITDISANSLKVFYPERAVETMIQEDQEFRPRLSRDLPSDARITDGYEIRFGARLSPSQNVAQILDGANFPVTKEAIDRQFIFKPTIFAGGYQASLLTRYVANSNVAAFNGGEMNRRPEEVMGNLGKLIESTYVATDGSGIRGYVEADGVNTVTVKRPYGLNLLAENNYISVRQSAGGAVRDSLDLRSVTDRDLDARILTYSGADQTAVADDPIYIVAELTQTLTALYANGLRGQVDDGVNATLIHTLDRTVAGNSKLKSVVLDNGGVPRNLTENLLIDANFQTRRRARKKPSTLIMGDGQVMKYIEFVAPQRMWTVSGSARQGKSTGFKPEELKHAAPGVDLDFMISFDALPGEVHGVSWDSFFLYRGLNAQWLSGHDMKSLLLLPGTVGGHKAAWGAYCVSVENWGTNFPLANFVIRDLRDRYNGNA
jgi:hypothetical protein